jgi:hypothetical protein
MNRRNMLGIRLRSGAHHTAIHDLLGRCIPALFARAALLAMAVVATAHAQIITPRNGSFENPTYTGGYDNRTPTDWTVVPGATAGFTSRQGDTQNYNFSPDMDGTCIYSLEANNLPGISQGYGAIQQSLGTMISGETYTFNATLFGNKEPDLNIGGLLSTFVPSYRISFVDVTLNMELAAITQADFNPGKGLNIPVTLFYKVGDSHAGNAMALRLTAVQPTIPQGYGGVLGRTGIDKVTVTLTPPSGTVISFF